MAMMRAHRMTPLRHRSFRRFLFGHFVSLVGDNIYFLALPWAAIEQGARPDVVGLLLAAAAIPRVAVMLGGGVVVDRVGSRLVMLTSDGVRTAVMVAAALIAFAGVGGVPGLFVIAVLFGIVDGFFAPAVGALVPALVAGDELAAGNGLRILAVRTAGLIGPPLSGVLVAAGSIGWAFLANAATFVASFSAMWSVRIAPAGAVVGTDRRFWPELFSGLKYVARSRALVTLLLVGTLASVGFSGSANVGLPLLVERAGWRAGGLGLLMGGLGAGEVLGAALLSLRAVPRAGSGAVLLAATAGQMICTGLTPFAGGLAATVAVQVGLGCASTVAGTSMITLLQTLAPREMLGRFTSLIYVSLWGLIPLAYALSGAVVGWFGLTSLFVVGAVIQVIGLALGLSSARVRSAQLPSAVEVSRLDGSDRRRPGQTASQAASSEVV